MDAEDFGGLRDVPLRVAQDTLKQMQLRCVLPSGIKLARAICQTLINKVVQIRESGRREGRRFGTGPGLGAEVVGQEIRHDDGAGGHQDGMLNHALQLADVAGPGVLLQEIQAAVATELTFLPISPA